MRAMQSSDVLGRRIAAGLIDLGVVLVIALLVGGIFGNDAAPDAAASASFGTLDRLLLIGLVLAYYFLTEALSGQTLGKRVMRIRVVGVDGAKASPVAIATRTVLRVIDGLFFYLVALIVILATGERRARLGDMAAKTKVVADTGEPPPPPEQRERPDDDDVLAQIMR